MKEPFIATQPSSKHSRGPTSEQLSTEEHGSQSRFICLAGEAQDPNESFEDDYKSNTTIKTDATMEDYWDAMIEI